MIKKPHKMEQRLDSVVFWVLIALIVVVSLIVLPYGRDNYLTIKNVVLQVGVSVAVFLSLLRIITTKRLMRTASGIYIPIVALLGASVLSMVNTPSGAASFKAFLRLAAYSLPAILVVRHVRSEKRLQMMEQAILAVGTGLAVYGILQFFGFKDFITLRGTGISASIGNQNMLGGLLVITFFIAVGQAGNNSSRTHRIAAGICGVLILFCILLTWSKGAWIALVCGSVAGLFMLRRYHLLRGRDRRTLGKVAKTFFIVALVALMAVAVLLGSGERMSKLAGDEIESVVTLKNSTYGRLFLWRVTVAMAIDQPFFGQGIGSFGILYPEYQEYVRSSGWRSSGLPIPPGTAVRAHNDYLQFWAETGLIGLAALVWLIAAFFGRVLPHLRTEDDTRRVHQVAYISAIIATLAFALVDFPFHVAPTALLFFLLIGMGCVRAEIARGDAAPRYDHLGLFESRLLRIEGILAGGMFFLAVIVMTLSSFIALIYREAGYRMFLENDLDNARWSLRTAATYDRSDAESHALLAVVYREMAALDENNGEHYLRRSIEEHQIAMQVLRDSTAHNSLGVTYARLNRLEEAAQQFERAVNLDPTSAETHKNLGIMRALQHNYDRAIISFKNAIQEETSYGPAYLSLAVMYEYFVPDEQKAQFYLRGFNRLNPSADVAAIKQAIAEEMGYSPN